MEPDAKDTGRCPVVVMAGALGQWVDHTFKVVVQFD